MLAKMGAALQLKPQPAQAEHLYDLRELLAARRALIKDQTASKTRRATSTVDLIKAQLDKRLRHIEANIDKIDVQMLDLVHADQSMAKRMEHLISIPGIGTNTALIILVDLPEIGSLTNKHVGSLAGLAPMPQSSGKWQGKARIMGGRPNLRYAICMPALVAIRFNLDVKKKYAALIAAGKEKKLAITAVMRKLLLLANALLRDSRKWVEKTT